MLLILLVVPLIASIGSCQQTAQLKGNLIFESPTPSPVTINPQYIQFNRKFDLTNIQQALDLLDSYASSYNTYCTEIQKIEREIMTCLRSKGTDFMPGVNAAKLR